MVLEKLCNAFGVSGCEDEVREIIIEEIKDHVDSLKIDRMGNIIAHKKGTGKKGPRIMLSAHMDEVGFMVKSIEESGFLKFSPVGGIDPRVLIGKKLHIGKEKISGVIVFKPVHVQRSDYKNVPDAGSLYIDIGAKDKKDAEKYVSVGDYCVFATAFERRGNIVKGKAFDDRLGCYAIMEILKKKISRDMYAVFLVQEEVGTRGAKIATYGIEPDYAFVLEGTSCGDIPSERDEAKYPMMSSGVVVTISDRTILVDRGLIDVIVKTAQSKGIRHQFKQPMIGGTDAGAIHITGKGVKAAVFAVPARYIHSSVGYADLDDLQAMIDLTHQLVNNIQ